MNYICIQGENKTNHFFAVIDCFVEEIVIKHLAYRYNSDDVRKAKPIDFLDRRVEKDYAIFVLEATTPFSW